MKVLLRTSEADGGNCRTGILEAGVLKVNAAETLGFKPFINKVASTKALEICIFVFIVTIVC